MVFIATMATTHAFTIKRGGATRTRACCVWKVHAVPTGRSLLLDPGQDKGIYSPFRVGHVRSRPRWLRRTGDTHVLQCAFPHERTSSCSCRRAALTSMTWSWGRSIGDDAPCKQHVPRRVSRKRVRLGRCPRCSRYATFEIFKATCQPPRPSGIRRHRRAGSVRGPVERGMISRAILDQQWTRSTLGLDLALTRISWTSALAQAGQYSCRACVSRRPVRVTNLAAVGLERLVMAESLTHASCLRSASSAAAGSPRSPQASASPRRPATHTKRGHKPPGPQQPPAVATEQLLCSLFSNTARTALYF